MFRYWKVAGYVLAKEGSSLNNDSFSWAENATKEKI